MQLSEILRGLEEIAPLALQEEYDNSGLIIGDPESEISSALLALDLTPEVMEEAVTGNHNLIITHHPFIFSGIKKVTGKSTRDKLLISAIRNKISIAAFHTNFDNVPGGVNFALGRKLGIKNFSILEPKPGRLKKIVVFCPEEHAKKVRSAMFDGGAGRIGQYDSCSFNTFGEGTFRALEGSNPFAGRQGELHFEKEVRIESVIPAHLSSSVIQAMKASHPYEEVAFDIYQLDNTDPYQGAGMIGELEKEMDESTFLSIIKKELLLPVIRHSGFTGKKIGRVAWCGGSGSFLTRQAIRLKADAFITGDIKYHQFQEAEGKILIADIGHFESEIHSIPHLKDEILKKFPNFACSISAHNTNAVHYH